MKKPTRSEASKIREASQKTAREYCPLFRIVRFSPCFKCKMVKGDRDCHGNPIGERDRLIAITRQSVQAMYLLPSNIGNERKKIE